MSKGLYHSVSSACRCAFSLVLLILVVETDHQLFTGPADMELEQSSAASGQYWTDIDASDHEDPMACTEYIHDIVCHLLEAEVVYNLICPCGAHSLSMHRSNSIVDCRESGDLA